MFLQLGFIPKSMYIAQLIEYVDVDVQLLRCCTSENSVGATSIMYVSIFNHSKMLNVIKWKNNTNLEIKYISTSCNTKIKQKITLGRFDCKCRRTGYVLTFR